MTDNQREFVRNYRRVDEQKLALESLPTVTNWSNGKESSISEFE